jgi:hypothetical protein
LSEVSCGYHERKLAKVAPGRGAHGADFIGLLRLDRFRRRHPRVTVTTAEFRGGWDATIPLEDDGERFLHRADLEQLLDDAETICDGGDPRARPD